MPSTSPEQLRDILTTVRTIALVGAKAYRTTTLSLGNASGASPAMDAEYWDTDGFHDLVTNTDRLPIPAGMGGRYFVYGSMQFNAHATGYRQLMV